MFTSTPISHVVKIKKFVSVLLLTSVVATSAVRDAYSSMKRFKCINVKTSLPGTPFANAKLLKLFLTGVRMLEEHLAASLGDLRGVRTGEKVDNTRWRRHFIEQA